MWKFERERQLCQGTFCSLRFGSRLVIPKEDYFYWRSEGETQGESNGPDVRRTVEKRISKQRSVDLFDLTPSWHRLHRPRSLLGEAVPHVSLLHQIR